MSATSIDVPNLRDGERAYRLASGDLVTVRITRLPRVDPEFIHLHCDGRAVSEDGTPTGVTLPASTHGIHLSGVGLYGHTTVAQELDRITAYALAAWPALVGVHAAFDALPVHEEESPPSTASA